MRVTILYILVVSEKVGRVLREKGIETAYKPINTLKNKLVS
mgnify:CR=1